jgi:hypothetical protein
MKSLFSCHFSFLVIPLILTLALGLADARILNAQTDEEWKWVEEHYERILNDLLSMKRNEGIYVTYRAVPGLHAYRGEMPEPYFLLGFDVTEKGYGLNAYVSAHVSTPDPVSIYNQMMDMHHTNPEESAESIEKKIKMTSLILTEMSCPAIRKRFSEFQELRFGPPYSNLKRPEGWMDAPSYEFHVQADEGHADLDLINSKHPLVVWAMKTQRELETCTSARNAQNTRTK